MESVKDLFQKMKHHGKNKAIISNNRILTYEQLIHESSKLASGLKKIIEPGDKISAWLPNSIDWILIQLAAGLIGATVIPLNLRYKIHELEYILKNSESKMFIFQPKLEDYNYEETVEQLFKNKTDLFPNLKYIVSIDETALDLKMNSITLTSLFQESNNDEELFNNSSSDETSIFNIYYTSGTTSRPKGVMLSQRTVIKHSSNAGQYLGIDSEDVVLGALPFCGIFGLNTLFASLISGASIVPMERYKPLDALQLIEQFQCTVFNGVDGMLTPLFGEEKLHYDLSSVKIGAYAIFSSNNRFFIEKTETIFPNMTVVQPYGMTEVGSLLFVGDPAASLEKRSLPGGPRVSPEIKVEIVHKETEKPLGIGEEGEIVIGGYSVMNGYYKNPEKTKESFTQDGMFKTGDLGVKLEDGSIIYKGRLREAIRLKGFLVSPKEIEDYICTMSEIDIVQVVQVSIDNLERLIALVKLQAGRKLSEKQILDYCKEGLADFKCPENILFINEFPTTAGSNGEKIQRNKLPEIALEEMKRIEMI